MPFILRLLLGGELLLKELLLTSSNDVLFCSPWWEVHMPRLLLRRWLLIHLSYAWHPRPVLSLLRILSRLWSRFSNR